MKSKMLDICMVIVSYNTLKLTRKCIESLYESQPNIKQIIVVDNNSSDGSIKYLSKISKHKRNFELVKMSENKGFAAANNKGIEKSKAKYVLLLNSDTEIKSNLFEKIYRWMEKHEEVGIASCKLVYPDGRLQANGGFFPSIVNVFSWMTIQDLPFVDRIVKPFHPLKEKSFSARSDFYTKRRYLDWVTGAFFMIRREVIDEIGGFDEKYFMYTEEVDYCFRAKKSGWKVVYLPEFEIVHHGGGSATKEFSTLQEFKGVKRFFKKFRPAWQYPFLRLTLKIGAFGRMFLFGLLEGRESARIYFKAFKLA